MATDTTRVPNLVVEGNLVVGGSKPAYARSELLQEQLQRYPIPWTAWRVWDALATNLPATPATDDLGLVGGTFGTGTPAIQTGDVKAAGTTTRYARAQIALPPEYDTAETITLRAHCEMITTVAGTSAVVDFEVYRSDQEVGVGSDLCTTAEQSMNSLTGADLNFTISPSTLAKGDLLDIRMRITVVDAATATAVIASVGAVELLLDIRG